MARLFRDAPEAIRTLEIAEALPLLARRAALRISRRAASGRRTPRGAGPPGLGGAAGAIPRACPTRVVANARARARADRRAALRALLPHRPRHRPLRALARHPLPGPRLGGQLGRLLLPRHHRGRPGAIRPAVRALRLAERNEPPDIDVDFEHERREEVIQYIYEKYGRDRAGIAATVIPTARAAPSARSARRWACRRTIVALAKHVWGWAAAMATAGALARARASTRPIRARGKSASRSPRS